MFSPADTCGRSAFESFWQRMWSPSNRKGSELGKGVRIDQGQDLNPDPEPLQAAFPRFPGVKPLQAEARNGFLKGEASQTKGIIVSNGGIIKAPNRGNKIPTICFMGLKTALVANQDVSPVKSMGPGPDPMTATQ
ncbi:hypothetical protein DSO57_1034880 [Entomophthora muscae]|uniref:Uncharacterized protein n=1 Tax=Entomophthora muscae TaxID=34485 RepID=A0ACC2S1V0_9FUNG|nr:hypothetical protein DSO57_1034880 [Entomophthora muscae]